MVIGVPRELQPGEQRAAMIPASIQKLVRAGAQVVIESGLGLGAGHSDEDYATAGAHVTHDRAALLAQSELVLRLHKPPVAEIAQLKRGAIHISYLDPFNEPGLIDAFVSAGVTAISMEMIPRTTLAQKMDALSSQANLAGYVMVLLAAARLPRILPMMMTPAGTIKPANVFVIGAGVAGLQAIATAKRLGRQVEAFDTRPVVEEQVQSLGAKFVEDRPRRNRPDQGRLRRAAHARAAREAEAGPGQADCPSPTSSSPRRRSSAASRRSWSRATCSRACARAA